MKQLSIILFVLMATFPVLGQDVEPVNIPPTPQAQEFLKYGDYNVSHFTGRPDISIPLFPLEYRGFTLPMSLGYNNQGVKPAYNFDVYGFGWSLFCGGEISRTINWGRDEKFDFAVEDMSSLIDYRATIESIYNNPRGNNLEHDDFHAQLPDGTSFKFFIEKDASGNNQVYTSPITEVIITPHVSNNSLESFTVLDKDGVKYIFDVVESTYGSSSSRHNSTWKLSTIILAGNAGSISFSYDHGLLIESTSREQSRRILNNRLNRPVNYADYGTTDVYQTSWSRSEMKLLTGISFGNTSILFNYTYNTNNPGRTENHLESIVFTRGTITRSIDFTITQGGSFGSSLKPLRVLDSLINQDKKYAFNYDNITVHSDMTDHWGNLTGRGLPGDNWELPPFTAVIYELDQLAHPNLSGKLDHWGNGYPNHDAIQLGSLNKESGFNNQGLLRKITYPTGGYTEFDFERHKYEETIDPETLSPIPGNIGTAATNRIRQIRNYSSTGILANQKTYTYGVEENGYGFAPVEPNALTYSSHSWYRLSEVNPLPCLIASNPCSFTLTSLVKAHEFVFNVNNFRGRLAGRPAVMYPEVTEYLGDETNNKGKSVYKFQIKDRYTGEFSDKLAGDDYQRLSESDWTYGQLYEQTDYANIEGSYIPRRKIEQVWNHYVIHEVPRYTLVKWYNPFAAAVTLHPEERFYRRLTNIKIGKIELNSKTVTSYFANGDSLKVKEGYTYNANGLIGSKTTVLNNANTEKIKELFSYPEVSSADSTLRAMASDDIHILSAIVKKETIRNAATIAGTKTDYSLFGSTYQPAKSYQLEIADSVLSYSENLRFNRYDQSGNVLETQTINGEITSYLWGYNRTRPIAVLKGIAIHEIEELLTDTLYLDETVPPEELEIIDIRSPTTTLFGNGGLGQHEATLRSNFPDAFITTYTYSDDGRMTSQTDFNGIITYYEYDSSGRLERIKDPEGNTLSQNEYNYGSN